MNSVKMNQIWIYIKRILTCDLMFWFWFLFRKFLKEGKCFVAHENAYVRYLLAFKLWKKISCKQAIRKSIIRMAVKKLDPPPQLIDSIKKMTNILPKMPGINQNMTLYLMNAKFNFIKAKLVSFSFFFLFFLLLFFWSFFKVRQ